ncbi:phage tail assembly protein [Acidocella sp.]|uniref:phage tail assembly protein n=1 Tax=Acidocella sp. TaxID=50710 RepID=UPI0026327A47|nr:phage tail assembly protein [Acidocella sp.]MDD2794361.1 phage tail assembly protein [Acidocella sp.]
MKLSKPIEAHGQTVTELTFREPNGGDLARNGFIYKVESTGNKVIDTRAIAGMISDMASIPPSSVAQMSVIDFSRAMGEVVGFFTDAETPSTS